MDTASDIFLALSDPRRRRILETLAANDLSVGELTSALDARQPAVSKHLKILRDAGLVTERQHGRCRIYTIVPQALRPIQDWVHNIHAYWGGTLDQLDNYLRETEGTPSDDTST